MNSRLAPHGLNSDAAGLGLASAHQLQHRPRDARKLTPHFFPTQKHRQGGEPGPRVPGEPLHVRPRPKLQSQLKQRIARFSGADITVLAADSGAGPRQAASEKHSRKIQDKLRRMRATFQ